jgi:hypothetical protein
MPSVATRIDLGYSCQKSRATTVRAKPPPATRAQPSACRPAAPPSRRAGVASACRSSCAPAAA